MYHPLSDPTIEVKRSAEGLGPMQMTPAVRWSLLTLRVYLLLMVGLVIYRLVHTALLHQ